MNVKILITPLIIISFMLLNACGFEVVKMSDRNQFKITELNTSGDRRVNFKIKNSLLVNSAKDNVNQITLDINTEGSILGYKLRDEKAKKQAILAFQSIGYKCIAAGDSYNDLQMFEVADQGFFINAPELISDSMPEIPSFNKYSDLLAALRNYN